MAIAIEQHACITNAEAQHAGQVVCGVFRQFDFDAVGQRQLDMDTGHAHDVASSMTSAVTLASSCNWLSSMQYGGIQYSVSPSGRSTTPFSKAAQIGTQADAQRGVEWRVAVAVAREVDGQDHPGLPHLGDMWQ